jgi:hypothetical protein
MADSYKEEKDRATVKNSSSAIAVYFENFLITN